MAVERSTTSDGLTEVNSAEALGVISGRRFNGENDNGVASGRRRGTAVAGAEYATHIDLSSGMSPVVEALLRKTLSYCEDGKREIVDEKILRSYLEQYRWKFDSIFDGTEYVRDLRVARLVRIFDYCYRIGFDCQDLFEKKLHKDISPEEAISTLRNFFRMTTIVITEKIGRPQIVTQMKISGIKNPNDTMLEAAEDLATSISDVTRFRLDEIYAALVMLKSGIID